MIQLSLTLVSCRFYFELLDEEDTDTPGEGTGPGAFSITGPMGLARRHAPPIRWTAAPGAVTYTVSVYPKTCDGDPLLSSGNIPARWTTWTPEPGFLSGSTLCVEVVAADASGNTTRATNSGAVVFSVDTTVAFETTTASVDAARNAMTAADLNRDGNIDVIANGGTGAERGRRLYVLFGRGDGTFAPEQPIASVLGDQIFGVETCDVNQDGRLDLVVNTYTLSKCGVFLGNELGGFDPLVLVAPSGGSRPTRGPHCADFDRDGNLDLFFIQPSSSAVSTVVYGNGDGTFQPPQVAGATTTNQNSSSTGDFNRDGYMDVAITLWSDAAWIHFGGPSGFTSTKLSGGWAYSQASAVADVNNDGWPDLFNAHWGADSLYLSDGAGALATGTQFAPGLKVYTNKLLTNDHDGDGNVDVLTIANDTELPVLHWGRGDGTFERQTPQWPRAAFSGGWGWGEDGDTIQADVNADGALDFVCLFPNGIYVRRHNGAGAFGSGAFEPGGSALGPTVGQGRAVLLSDFDRNGTADMLVGYADAPDRIHLGQGDGSFASGVEVSADSSNTLALQRGDVDRDGIDDVVVGTDGADRVLLGVGDGTFKAGGTVAAGSGSSTHDIALFDVDHDGKLDIVAARSPGGAEIHAGNGDGTFGPARPLGSGPQGGVSAVAVADFNQDGQIDVVTGNAAAGGAPMVHAGRADGSFAQGSSVAAVGAAVGGLAAADFNRDGAFDLVIARGKQVSIHLGDGTWGFSAQDTVDLEGDATAVEVADLDHDGVSDVVVSTAAPGESFALRVLRPGIFDEALPLGKSGHDARDVAIGDVDRDGKTDAVVAFSDAPPRLYRGRDDLASSPLPAVQNLAAKTVLPDEIELTLDDDGAAGYLVVGREGNDVTFVPQDGVVYTAGPQGADEVVFAGSGEAATHSGLTPLAVHHYRVFAFDAGKTYSVFASLTVRTPDPVCGGPGDGCYDNSLATTTGWAKTPGGRYIAYAFANGTDGFRVWRAISSKVALRPSGLDAWATKLEPDGKGRTTSNLAVNGLGSADTSIVGRVCPPNVYLDDNNRVTAGECLYYSPSYGPQSLSAAGTSQTETGSIGLEDWGSYNSGEPRWYVGNIETCSALGMRLPTAFETTTPAGAWSDLPWSDGNPAFPTASEQGVPSNGSSATWTATSIVGTETTLYHAWYADGAGADATRDAASASRSVVCVLP